MYLYTYISVCISVHCRIFHVNVYYKIIFGASHDIQLIIEVKISMSLSLELTYSEIVLFLT